ncbi:hypothetical protein BGZ81_000480, partial [Podila clonocystis]
QSINLGHNTFIQPTTQVLPQTSYQPTVNQLTTDIQAAPIQDQSLPQSSVQLGSSVNIVPTVTVTPLTTFQPTVQSLPFIINVAPCVDTAQFAGAAYGAAPFASSFGASSNGAGPSFASSIRSQSGAIDQTPAFQGQPIGRGGAQFGGIEQTPAFQGQGGQGFAGQGLGQGFGAGAAGQFGQPIGQGLGGGFQGQGTAC